MKIIESGGLVGLAPMRRRAGMTQYELAERVGISRALVAMYETGRAWPSARILPDLAGALVCSIDELFEVPEEPAAEDEDAG